MQPDAPILETAMAHPLRRRERRWGRKGFARRGKLRSPANNLARWLWTSHGSPERRSVIRRLDIEPEGTTAIVKARALGGMARPSF